jgi:hypothetical protein
MVGPLGVVPIGLGAPTIQCKNIDGEPPGRRCQISGSAHHSTQKHRRQAPWEAMVEIKEHPPLNAKTLMVGPLGGGARDPGAPTTQRKNINDGAPGRQC